MENSTKVLYIAFSVIVFCLAFIFIIHSFNVYSKSLSIARNSKKPNVVYEQIYTGTDTVSYAELIATLSYPLDYDIVINNIEISKNTYGAGYINDSFFPQTDYKKRYEYTPQGNILRVIYEPIS